MIKLNWEDGYRILLHINPSALVYSGEQKEKLMRAERYLNKIMLERKTIEDL